MRLSTPVSATTPPKTNSVSLPGSTADATPDRSIMELSMELFSRTVAPGPTFSCSHGTPCFGKVRAGYPDRRTFHRKCSRRAQFALGSCCMTAVGRGAVQRREAFTVQCATCTKQSPRASSKRVLRLQVEISHTMSLSMKLATAKQSQVSR